MTVESLEKICSKLPGVTADIKWEDHLCFNVAGKMFLVTSPDSVPVTASFKVTEDVFNELTTRTGITPAKYLAKHKWIFVEDISILSADEWERLISLSHSLVASKLPVKIRKQLGLA